MTTVELNFLQFNIKPIKEELSQVQNDTGTNIAFNTRSWMAAYVDNKYVFSSNWETDAKTLYEGILEFGFVYLNISFLSSSFESQVKEYYLHKPDKIEVFLVYL